VSDATARSADDGAASPTPPTGLLSHGIVRYALAMIGPVGSAAAQFALSLVLLKLVDSAAFGRFSFLMIASQLSWGVWSALFCAPLPILLATRQGEARDAVRRCLLTASLAGSILAFAIFVGIVLALGEGWPAALLFAGYAAVSLLRWFARSLAYAAATPLRTAASDIAYSIVVLAGTLLLWLDRTATMPLAGAVLLTGAAVGMLPFGRTYLRQQFGRLSAHDAARYGAIWREHSGWSLFGVVTTEATANAHAYLVTLILGPTQFAPVAASAIMIRPINVAMNALTEFERAQMARHIGARRIDLARHAVRFFRVMLLLAWIATGVAIVAILRLKPHLIFPARYDLDFLLAGTALWMAVSLIRLLRTPESALLQAAGAFRPLALASAWSAAVSIVAVLALLLAGGALWSIAGIGIGEILFAVAIWRRTRDWMRGADVAPENATLYPHDDAEVMAAAASLLPVGAKAVVS
jgi:O-antigen/teichoic acid export membrane protein